MAYIQINLSETIDKKLQHYKIDRELVTKADAVVEIVEDYFRNNPDFFTIEKPKRVRKNAV